MNATVYHLAGTDPADAAGIRKAASAAPRPIFSIDVTDTTAKERSQLVSRVHALVPNVVTRAYKCNPRFVRTQVTNHAGRLHTAYRAVDDGRYIVVAETEQDVEDFARGWNDAEPFVPVRRVTRPRTR